MDDSKRKKTEQKKDLETLNHILRELYIYLEKDSVDSYYLPVINKCKKNIK